MTWAIEEKGYSQRRACALVGLRAKTFRYVSRRPDDGETRRRLRELASQRRRFGYRRLHILLRREGVELNHKKLFRMSIGMQTGPRIGVQKGPPALGVESRARRRCAEPSAQRSASPQGAL